MILMANPRLTVKQFATIVLGQTAPPWQLSKVLNAYGQKLLVLGATISNLSQSTAVMFVSFRKAVDVASFVQQALNMASPQGSLTSPDLDWNYLYQVMNDEFWKPSWSGSVYDPANLITRSDLEEFQAILTPAGASIVYLSPKVEGPEGMMAWTIVGIAGSFGNLTNLNGQVLPFDYTKWTVSNWNMLRSLKTGLVLAPALAGNTMMILT
jgi:hypothetical protein